MRKARAFDVRGDAKAFCATPSSAGQNEVRTSRSQAWQAVAPRPVAIGIVPSRHLGLLDGSGFATNMLFIRSSRT